MMTRPIEPPQPPPLDATPEQIEAWSNAREKWRVAQSEAEQRYRDQLALQEWNRERRELWKSIITNVTVGCAIRGDVPTREVLQSANRAVEWFDEMWGAEFPVDLLKRGGQP
jgi:hypothetical protein